MELSKSKQLFADFLINFDDIPDEQIPHYTAVEYYLVFEDEPASNAHNLDKVNRYMQALHHICYLQKWILIKFLLNAPIDISTSKFKLSIPLCEYLLFHRFSINLLDSIQEIEALLKNTEYEEIFLLILKARALSDMSEKVNQSHQLFDKIRAKTKKNSKEYLEATAYLGISQVNFSGLYSSGVKNINESLDIFNTLLATHQELGSSLKWQDMRTDMIENLALYQMNSSHFQLAMELYSDAITIRQHHKIYHRMIVPLLHKGVLLRRLRKYEQAIQSLTEAMSIAIELNSESNIAWIEHHLAYVYLNKGDYKQADIFCQKSLYAYKNLGNLRAISDCYEQLGFVNLARNDLSRAEIYFKNGLVQRERISNFNGVASSILDLSLIAWHKKQYFQAFFLLLKGFNLYAQLNILTFTKILRILKLTYTWTLGSKKWTM